jgi:hypothetical protein
MCLKTTRVTPTPPPSPAVAPHQLQLAAQAAVSALISSFSCPDQVHNGPSLLSRSFGNGAPKDFGIGAQNHTNKSVCGCGLTPVHVGRMLPRGQSASSLQTPTDTSLQSACALSCPSWSTARHLRVPSMLCERRLASAKHDGARGSLSSQHTSVSTT